MLNDYVSIKNIHRYVIRYVISLYLHQSHFKNKIKCDIAVTCRFILQKRKERYNCSIVVCYFSSYIKLNLICVIKSKQNLLFESKCMFQTHSKKYDGYKALKILEVISIVTFRKTIIVDSQKISDAYKLLNVTKTCPHKYNIHILNLLIVLKIIIIV